MSARASLYLVAMLLAVPAPASAQIAKDPLGSLHATAPDFTVRRVDGGKLQLATLRREGPVLLDFWATWCKPCLASLPELEALHRRFAARGVSVVGVSIDGPRNFAKVRPFAARLGLTYPIVVDEDGGLQRGFHVLAVPTSILIGRDGVILSVQQGYRPGETELLAAAIERALAPAEVAPPPGAAPAAAPADSTAPSSEGAR
jgi:peroxiredoxin